MVNGGEQFLLGVVVNGVAGVCVGDGVIERGAKMGVACVELCELKLAQFSSGILGMCNRCVLCGMKVEMGNRWSVVVLFDGDWGMFG